MKEKITPYLRALLDEPAMAAQYSRSGVEDDAPQPTDPLGEEEHEVVKGLVHKYTNRALIKVSYQCAAHCRFCTRIRQIGQPAGTLTEADMAGIVAYLQAHPEVDDVILSGGDALYTPLLTAKLLSMLAAVPSVKVLRIGTRLPVQLPEAVLSKTLEPLLGLVSRLATNRPFFVLVHINHPAELSPKALEALAALRKTGATILSQTVFLHGVNDDAVVLGELFVRLYHAGVLPYYIYHCDAVAGLERFVVPLRREQEIMTTLHATLSGIAVPRHVLDVEDGYGKLSVPQLFLDGNGQVAQDYNNLRL